MIILNKEKTPPPPTITLPALECPCQKWLRKPTGINCCYAFL